VSDIVEKTSTRRRSRMPCVVVLKITTRRREGVGVVVEKNEESRRTFNKNSCDLLRYSNNAHRNSGCPLHISHKKWKCKWLNGALRQQGLLTYCSPSPYRKLKKN